MSPALEVRELTVSYGSAYILHDVSLEARDCEIMSIVGPNGAGKTTLLRAMAGLVRWEQQTSQQSQARLEGQITLYEERIDGLPPHKIASRGLILCPERRRPFRDLSVRENLMAGAYLVRDRRVVAERFFEVYRLFPVLEKRSRQRAGTLSGGEQQMLAIGRSLMGRPKLLLIDEPSTGLAPLVKEPLFAQIREIMESGIGVVLVEQDAGVGLSLASQGYVLSQGQIVADGSAQQLMDDGVVRQSYLGL
jgi:branched-chain amino acid transport system ATP-binding protein